MSASCSWSVRELHGGQDGGLGARLEVVLHLGMQQRRRKAQAAGGFEIAGLGQDAQDDLQQFGLGGVGPAGDSRVTLEFVLNELQKASFGTIGVAVLHEKIKPKKGKLPEGLPYYSGITLGDAWINYPWDAEDIDEHNRLAASVGWAADKHID